MRAQEVYNQYCRKEISKEDFLYWMRRDPIIKEHFSPLNSADDVVRILKNKALISEQVANEDYLIIQEKEVEDQNGEAAPESPEYGEEIGEYADGDKDKYEEIDDTYGTDEVREALTRNDQLGFDLPGEAMNAILLHRDWADRWDVTDTADVNIINTWRKSIIDKSKALQRRDRNADLNENSSAKKTLNADDVNYFEFTRGWRYEYEKNPKIQQSQDIDKAKTIALKNLLKDPMYYSDLLIKQTTDKQKKDTELNNKRILKFPTKDEPQLKDKENQMKVMKKNVADKSNVKTNLGNQEKAKGMPKGVKALKENIRKELRAILKEAEYVKRYDDIMQHAKLDAMKEEESEEDYGGDNLTNERTTVGDFDTWKKSVLDVLKTTLKVDDKAAGKIFTHYAKDFKANHEAGKDAKAAVKSFAAGLKKVKEGSVNESGRNKPTDKFYIVVFRPDEFKILEGYSTDKEAKDDLKSYEHQEGSGSRIKILPLDLLKSKGIDPSDDKHWEWSQKSFQEDTSFEKTIDKPSPFDPADAKPRTKGENIDRVASALLSKNKKDKVAASDEAKKLMKYEKKPDMQYFWKSVIHKIEMGNVQEEFEGNTPPEKSDFQDVSLGSELNEDPKSKRIPDSDLPNTFEKKSLKEGSKFKEWSKAMDELGASANALSNHLDDIMKKRKNGTSR